MAPVVAEFQRICETCRNPFITAVRYPSIRPRRTCSRSCAARLPRRHQPLSERFWRYVTRTPTCWLWTGLHTPNGAGVIPVREQGRVRRMTAAQVAWELHVGPIPAGRRVWRRCRRPACVRPDHLVLVRRGQPSLITDPATGAQTETPVRAAGRGHALSGRADGRRTWWTRERVLAGLVAYHAATGRAPTTSRHWAGLVRSLGALGQHPRHYPSEYAVLRHFPSFRAAWDAAGIQIDDAHWAPWTASDDSYLVTHLGVQPTTSIAVTLRRGEAAVRTRARKLGLHVGLARGWPLLRVARTAGISEYVLRDYVDRGELPVFKGAKHVYLDPADLPAVKEIDCQHLPSELESAVLRSLRWRLVRILAGQDWRTMQPHHLHQRENRRPR
jgi:HNH endonuclease